MVLFVHLSSFTKILHKCITSAVFIGAFSILPDRLGAHLYVPITVRLHRGYTRPRNSSQQVQISTLSTFWQEIP